MKSFNIKIEILPNYYLKKDGTFDKEGAINICGKIAGVCYDKEGFNHLLNEDLAKTNRRIEMTLNNGHHSVYDHIMINFNLQNIPKILSMVLNNEHQYTTSEKSARYTPIEKKDGSIITDKEVKLYNKWIDIFKTKITEKYGNVYNESKIIKLAQENARYLITVFMPTQMIYSTTFRQINYIYSWMMEYIKNCGEEQFEKKLSSSMKELCIELERINVIEKRLCLNEKSRKLSLFGNDLDKIKDYFGNVYITTYKGTFAQLAQAHRHRTLDYKIELLEKKEYFIPPIIKNDDKLVKEWLNDINKIKNVNPQGELILINEKGSYEDFILKCKERLCSAAQLEINNQTRTTLLKYQKELEKTNNPLKNNIKHYTKGARCTFKDFKCTSDCKFKEGKTLEREI